MKAFFVCVCFPAFVLTAGLVVWSNYAYVRYYIFYNFFKRGYWHR